MGRRRRRSYASARLLLHCLLNTHQLTLATSNCRDLLYMHGIVFVVCQLEAKRAAKLRLEELRRHLAACDPPPFAILKVGLPNRFILQCNSLAVCALLS